MMNVIYHLFLEDVHPWQQKKKDKHETRPYGRQICYHYTTGADIVSDGSTPAEIFERASFPHSGQ